MGFDEFRHDLVRQQLEDLGVAEKTGDVDKQVFRQLLQFTVISAQQVEITGHVVRLDRGQCHAALDPPLQGARLVKRIVMRRLVAQERDDIRQAAGCPDLWPGG